jgi:transcriptional regulator with XRE-family HTH domain
MSGSQRRRRRTEVQVEAERLARSIALAVGGEARRERRRHRRSQRQVADTIGIDQSRLSQIERGFGDQVPLELWVALGVALGRPLAVSFSKGLDPAANLADAGHLEIQEHVLALASATGRPGTFELPTRPDDPSRSTDVGIRDPERHLRILVECWNTFGDLGAAIRSTTRKSAQATATWPDDRIATVWVVRASAANRAMLARYPHLFASTFDGSSRRWVGALTNGGAPPDRPGLVWFDPGTRRLVEWRGRTG